MQRQVIQDDLIQYGLIPEFVGRLPIVTPLDNSTAETLVTILTQPKNAIVRQYQAFFQMEDALLEFTHEALLEIAQRALARNTGARALRSVMEDLMLDLLYELPDAAPKGGTYRVSVDAVKAKTKLADLRVPESQALPASAAPFKAIRA